VFLDHQVRVFAGLSGELLDFRFRNLEDFHLSAGVPGEFEELRPDPVLAVLLDHVAQFGQRFEVVVCGRFRDFDVLGDLGDTGRLEVPERFDDLEVELQGPDPNASFVCHVNPVVGNKRHNSFADTERKPQ